MSEITTSSNNNIDIIITAATCLELSMQTQFFITKKKIFFLNLKIATLISKLEKMLTLLLRPNSF